jgi:hypothetical protein
MCNRLYRFQPPGKEMDAQSYAPRVAHLRLLPCPVLLHALVCSAVPILYLAWLHTSECALQVISHSDRPFVLAIGQRRRRLRFEQRDKPVLVARRMSRSCLDG